MYDAVIRNGYLLPSKKDGFCSFDFLDGVRTGENWLPKAKDCTMYSCLCPPPKDELSQIVADGIMQNISNCNLSEQ